MGLEVIIGDNRSQLKVRQSASAMEVVQMRGYALLSSVLNPVHCVCVCIFDKTGEVRSRIYFAHFLLSFLETGV